MPTLVLLVLSVLVPSALEPSAQQPSAADGERPTVYTTFYPTTWMTQRIAGDLVEVVCPVPEDADPIFWKPTREDIAAYQGADLIVINGAEFEKWVEAADLPLRTVVRTARGFKDRWIKFDEGVTHSHGPEGDHTHEGTDGHTWLDPVLAKQQAKAILGKLKRLLPDHVGALHERGYRLAADLDKLHAQLVALGTPAEGEALVASHPAYNYLARRLGWAVVNLDFDPEEMPSEEAFADARHLLEHEGFRYRVMLWEGAPTDAIAKATEENLGVKSIEFSPCEMLSADARHKAVDYMSVMQANIARLAPFLTPPREDDASDSDSGGSGS